MRDLQHVGTEIGPGAEQPLLFLDFRVAGQHQPDAVESRAQHERGVVRIRPGAGERERRAEHVEVHVPDVDRAADRRGAHRQAELRGDRMHELGAGSGIVEGAGEQRTDAPLPHGAGQPADVIEMEMGQHEQWDGGDLQISQAAVDQYRVGTGVDLHRGMAAGVQHQRVALADVASDENPAGRRPARGDRAHRDQHGDGSDAGRREYPPWPGARRDGDHHYEQQEQRKPARDAARPRDGGAVQAAEESRYRDQPPARPPGDPREHDTAGEPHRRQNRRAEPGDRRDAHDRFGEHVRRHCHQAHPAVERGDHGDGDQVRGRGDGH